MFSDHEGINFKEVRRVLQDQAAGEWWSLDLNRALLAFERCSHVLLCRPDSWGEQVCAWWARDAGHLAPGASCQMLTAAGDSVLLGPACANAREFRLTSIITKGLVCSTPGASVFGDAGVN